MSDDLFTSASAAAHGSPSLKQVRVLVLRVDTTEAPKDQRALAVSDSLTVGEKALLDARLAAYAKDPDAGSPWDEVENRIRASVTRQLN